MNSDNITPIRQGVAVLPASARLGTLSAEDADCVRLFLSAVRPTPDCCFCGNEQFQRGRGLLERLGAEKTVELGLWQCADILSYIHSVYPLEGTCFCGTGDEVTCGYHIVLEHIESRLRDLSDEAPEDSDHE